MTQVEPNPIESTGAILTEHGYCIRIPKQCVFSLSTHNLLLVNAVEYKGNFYLKPSAFTNKDVMEVMRHTPELPDS